MRAIITGSNSGLGFHTALALAADGFQVVLAVRSQSRGVAAKELIRAQYPDSQIEVASLNLASLNSVRLFAFEQDGRPWDLLINNAGAKILTPYKMTEDGFEWHTGVNHLGHFALTAGLWPSRSDCARVVTVSSVVAARAQLNPASITEQTFSESRAYEDSKLLNLLFASNLARLIDEAGDSAASVAAHPGFSRAEPYGTKITRLAELALAQSAESGARSLVRATQGINGQYFGPKVFQLWGEPKLISKPATSMDLALMKSIWTEAEEATQTKFRV